VTGTTLSVILNGTSYSYALSDTQLVHARTHAGDDTVKVVSTALSIPVTAYVGTGNDVITISPTAHSFANIQRGVTVVGGPATTLPINDQANSANSTWNITSTRVNRSGTAFVYYTGVGGVVINAGSGSSAINVSSTAVGTGLTVNAGGGNDTFNVGTTTHRINSIQGSLYLNGGTGTATLTIN